MHVREKSTWRRLSRIYKNVPLLYKREKRLSVLCGSSHHCTIVHVHTVYERHASVISKRKRKKKLCNALQPARALAKRIQERKKEQQHGERIVWWSETLRGIFDASRLTQPLRRISKSTAKSPTHLIYVTWSKQNITPPNCNHFLFKLFSYKFFLERSTESVCVNYFLRER